MLVVLDENNFPLAVLDKAVDPERYIRQLKRSSVDLYESVDFMKITLVPTIFVDQKSLDRYDELHPESG